jgi:Protein of unknown function (DUF1367)
MRAKGVFIVSDGSALLPNDKRAHDLLARLNCGDRVLVRVHRARNPEHHNLAWAVWDRIGAARGVPGEVVLSWLKLATGRVDWLKLPNGRLCPQPQSIAFESMSQEEFQAFWDEAWPIICEYILPDLPQEEFDKLVNMVAGTEIAT